MKNTVKLVVLAIAFIAATTTASAQRFFVVDSEYILKNIPEYQEAQKELDALSVQWQKNIEAKYTEIDKLYKSYQADQVFLTEDMKQKREQEIIQKEKAAKEYQKSKFGVEGELFTKRQELVKPIQDKIYDAIKQIADQGQYAAVFDRAAQNNVLYSNPKYDKSDEVLRKLGISANNE
jgi:outer membrane protein